MNYLKRYIRIRRVRFFGAPLLVRGSVFVFAGLLLLIGLNKPLNAIAAIASYFAVLLVHEAGHAYMAKRQRLPRIEIRIGVLHGVCEFEAPDYAKQDYLVAWGGALAQLAVAVPIVVLDEVFNIGRIDPLGAIVMFLGYVNIGIAAFNLIPAAGLDGEKAWKLIPLWLEERRERTFRPSRKQRRFRLIRRNHD